MKTLTLKAIANLLLCFTLFLNSCKKDIAPSQGSTSVSSDDISGAEAAGKYQTASGYTKLVLQPGDGTGQDAWIDFYTGPDSSIYNNGNSGQIDQFKCEAWTINGYLVLTRTLLRFDALAQVPPQSKLLSAKLYLYGLSSSDIHLPQGNSNYKGSPYNAYGTNDIYVQRVTSPWDESSVTWNTRPSSVAIGESAIPRSITQWNYNTGADVTRIVKYIIDHPSENYGFLLKHATEQVYRSMGFRSSENSDAAKRPKLVIVYQ